MPTLAFENSQAQEVLRAEGSGMTPSAICYSHRSNLARDLESSLSRQSTEEHAFTVWMDKCGPCEEKDDTTDEPPENTASHLPTPSFALTLRRRIQTAWENLGDDRGLMTLFSCIKGTEPPRTAWNIVQPLINLFSGQLLKRANKLWVAKDKLQEFSVVLMRLRADRLSLGQREDGRIEGTAQVSGLCTRRYEDDEPLAREWLKHHHPGWGSRGLTEEKVINQVWARQSLGAAWWNLIRVRVRYSGGSARASAGDGCLLPRALRDTSPDLASEAQRLLGLKPATQPLKWPTHTIKILRFVSGTKRSGRRQRGEDQGVHGHFWQQKEFKACLGHVSPCQEGEACLACTLVNSQHHKSKTSSHWHLLFIDTDTRVIIKSINTTMWTKNLQKCIPSHQKFLLLVAPPK